MENATRLTNLEVTGRLAVSEKELLGRLELEIAANPPAKAAGAAPTKAEFDAAVEFVNELKEKYEKLVYWLCGVDV